jgi:hypothetical protein
MVNDPRVMNALLGGLVVANIITASVVVLIISMVKLVFSITVS